MTTESSDQVDGEGRCGSVYQAHQCEKELGHTGNGHSAQVSDLADITWISMAHPIFDAPAPRVTPQADEQQQVSVIDLGFFSLPQEIQDAANALGSSTFADPVNASSLAAFEAGYQQGKAESVCTKVHLGPIDESQETW